MIKEVISILGDIASGKIKDERMALLADQLRDTDRKLIDATAEISALKSKVSELNSIVAKFEMKAKNEDSGHKMKWGCVIFEGDETLYCPKCFFNGGRKIPTSRVNSRLRFCAVCDTGIPT